MRSGPVGGGKEVVDCSIDNDKKDDRNDTGEDITEAIDIVVDIVRIPSQSCNSIVPKIIFLAIDISHIVVE